MNATRFGQATPAIATDNDDKVKFQTSGITSVYGSYGQSVAIGTIVNRVDTTKTRVEQNIQVSQSIRNRINQQRNQDKQIRDQLRKQHLLNKSDFF